MIALIMAGGTGTRFWPVSRKNKPKQFLRISGDKSMLQLTVDRLNGLIPIEKTFIVTTQSQIKLVIEHLPGLPLENIIIEPFGMNTAPCIGLSLAYLSGKIAPTETIVVLPADHVILDTIAFRESLLKAEQPASEGNLVTFGIVPDYPATGYGYIEAGESFSEGVFQVKRFKEKPDLDTAKSFLRQGNFYWNSGMFFWRADVINRAFTEHLPEVTALLEEIKFIWKHKNIETNIIDLYAKMPRIPIDIGIMEKAEKRAVIPVNYGWSDVGSWKALAEISEKDINGNYIPINSFTMDASNNYIASNKFVSIIGVDNLCVIETDDAILITAKDDSEKVKQVVDFLVANNKDNLL